MIETTRQITFAGSTVTLESRGAAAHQVAALLLANLGPANQTAAASHWTLRLVGEESLQVYAGPTGTPLELVDDDHAVAVVRRLGYYLADQSKDGLLFHAAALSWHAHGLLLPGGTQAGKTTLSAWLLTQGFSYLSDELVYLPQGSAVMQAFSRPLNLRLKSLAALQAELALELTALTPSDGMNTLIAPSCLGAATVQAQANLKLIIFPCYAPEQPLRFTRLAKAEAALRLMEGLVNARNLAHHGFPDVTRLVREVPAYALSYSCFRQLSPWLAHDLPEALDEIADCRF